jgi:hypothetical protein
MSANHISEFLIERYVIGEVSAEERRRVESSERALARAEEIRQSNDAILETYPAQQVAAEVRRRAALRDDALGPANGRRANGGNGPKRTPWRGLTWGWAAIPAAAAAALLAVFVFYQPAVDRVATESEVIRVKGMEPQLTVYRQTASDSAEELENGARAEAGDRLQLSYNAAGSRYGVIFSIDGRAQVTLHFPASERETPSLEASGEVVLPYGYRLDDAPRFERFYFVTSADEFSVSALLENVQKQVQGPRSVSADRSEASDLEVLDVEFPSRFVVTDLTLRKGE